MRHTIHTPTGDFAYVATEIDPKTEDIGDAVLLHQAVVKVIKGEAGIGLTDKEFNQCLDVYLATKQMPNGADLYPQMNLVQQNVVQAIKRSFARTKNK